LDVRRQHDVVAVAVPRRSDEWSAQDLPHDLPARRTLYEESQRLAAAITVAQQRLAILNELGWCCAAWSRLLCAVITIATLASWSSHFNRFDLGHCVLRGRKAGCVVERQGCLSLAET